MAALDELPDRLKAKEASSGGTESFGFSLPQGKYNAATYFVDRHPNEGRAGKVAFVDDRGSCTYQEFSRRVNRAGRLLRQLGVEPEQRVMLCLLDEINFPAIFWGAIKIGAVAVPVSTFVAPADYDYLLRDSRARVLVVSAPVLERIRPAIDGKVHLKAVLVSGAASSDLPSNFASFDALSAQAGEELSPADTVADDVAFWLYSSGATGEPKGAVHLHADFLAAAHFFPREVLGIGENDIVFSVPRLFFAYALSHVMSATLHLGATEILMAERPTPAGVMKVMKARQPTVFFAVPTLYAAILADPALDRSQSSERLRLCASAGESLPEHISRRWKERFGVEILDGLGTTETFSVFISNRPDDFRYGTAGKPVPSFEVRLLDENSAEVPDGEVGDLWCRGLSTCPGYWNKRELSARTFFGRWMKTGDKCVREPGGYYRYAGRADDMLKVGGIWVSPVEVEAALGSHPDVLEAAVVGARDADGLVKPKAFVVLKSGVAATPDLAAALTSFVKSQLAPYKYPRWIEFCNELPRTATGKVQRFKLRMR